MTTDQRQQPCPRPYDAAGHLRCVTGTPSDEEPIIQTHPTADMFPMLSADELHDLAESIKTEGQHEAIVLSADGVLLDGRNRLAACEIAGVEPRFTTYSGSDPKGLILAHNLRRRHISKGQQAMIVAMARSFSEHSLRHQAKVHSISLTRLSNAATVLKHNPPLAEQVRSGQLSLDAAYSTVRERQARSAEIQAQHGRLREHAPDLAEQVVEGLRTLDNAIAALDQRQHEEQLRQSVQHTDALRLADGDSAPPLAQLVERGDITWEQAHQRAEEFLVHRRNAVQQAQQALRVVAENWATVQDLAARPETPYRRDILDGLTPEVRSLVQNLTALA
ncbi:ParB/RepB/Spo0J family partition protein [Streptomyces griseus]|uniref:ParB/RepB/Spo0J family partition protein n=1 Tax=Streptomyces griseus TaxID=1911 RepID=UPI000AEA946D|nr:ParB/RepB/Spo0J family partition protein [Streptomyces griseus]